jgi:hypothetical protein
VRRDRRSAGRAVNVQVLIPFDMSASYRIDLRAGVVFTVFEGHVTNEELLAHQQRLAADPNLRPTMNHVLDTRGVTSVSVTALGIRLIASRTNFGPESRRAIIVGVANPSYDYLRMFEALRHQSGADIKFFSTVEDAHRWLGLESLPRLDFDS